MAALKRGALVACACLALGQPSAKATAAAHSVADWRAYSAEASARFGVPVAWIERVMRAESAGNTHWGGRAVTSPAGAMGLMQLMPATWAAMRARYALGRDPYDPHDNIMAGAAYLRLMYDRFGYPGLFAAYNAGPRRYAASLASGRLLPRETRAYLAEVTGETPDARGMARQAPAKKLFVIVADRNGNADARGDGEAGGDIGHGFIDGAGRGRCDTRGAALFAVRRGGGCAR